MYDATAKTFIYLIQRKKQSRNFFKVKTLFFDRIAMHKFVWSKKFCWNSWNSFIGWTPNRMGFVYRDAVGAPT